ncbi:MAG: DUF222 domain-containing protein [Mycobacterium sp.]|nr:DUF222 domain-containing protein [Mycobacterium sp.]
MFDAPGSFVGVDDSALVNTITACARAEAQAAAARLAAIAELTARRIDDQGERERWACDGWDAAAAEVGAALTIGRHAASKQMSIATALRDRLPKVAATFAAGAVSAAMIATVTWRTRLVTDPDVLAVLDTALAAAMGEWGPLSENMIIQKIDGWVAKFDPAAVIQSRAAARSRTVQFGKPDDQTGTVSIWGALLATDAELLDQVLTELARQVCEDDPRAVGQRRADALGVLAARGDRLACQCGSPLCLAAGADARASAVVIHVLTDALPAPLADPLLSGQAAAPLTPVADARAGEEPTTTATPVNTPSPAPTPVGYVVGGPVVPPALLADLAARGARVHSITSAAELDGVPRYRPSTAIDEFVRMRAMTCMFPGCDQPAVSCDVDHTIPWPAGPTHPGNLSPKCRKHHLLKTFYGGPTGWQDRQLPDGSIAWAAPTGHTYTSVPGSRILFPDKIIDTPLPPTPRSTVPDLDAPQTPSRGVMMPIRRRTRNQDRAARIAHERQLNQADLDRPIQKLDSTTQLSTHTNWDDILTRQHPPDDRDPPPF